MWKWKEKYIFLLLSIHVLPPFISISTIIVIYIFALVIVIVIAIIMINLVSPLKETVQVVSVDASQKKYRCSPVEMFMFPLGDSSFPPSLVPLKCLGSKK